MIDDLFVGERLAVLGPNVAELAEQVRPLRCALLAEQLPEPRGEERLIVWYFSTPAESGPTKLQGGLKDKVAVPWATRDAAGFAFSASF